MARSYAFTIIEGNLGSDPEMRYTPSGIAVATVNVAVSRPYKESGSEEWSEETTWYRCVVWRDAAERFARGQKGDFVRVQGRIHTTSWDVDGCPKGQHHGFELVADRADILGRFEKRGDGDFGRSTQDAYVDQLAAGRGQQNAPVGVGSGVEHLAQDLDDLPF